MNGSRVDEFCVDPINDIAGIGQLVLLALVVTAVVAARTVERGVRTGAAMGALVTVLDGIVWRNLPMGSWSNQGGIVCYAILIYCLTVLVAPASRPHMAGVFALAECWNIEVYQLTGIPRLLSDLFGDVPRWVLGVAFSWEDMLFYAPGVLLATLIHWASLRMFHVNAPFTQGH